MDVALRDLFTKTVTIAPWAGQGQSGEPQWGAAVSYSAQISGQNRLVWDAAGKQVLSTLRVILNVYAVIGPKDKVTLPSEYPVASPPILAVEFFPNDVGNDHTTVHLR